MERSPGGILQQWEGIYWVIKDNGLSGCEVEYRKKFLVNQGRVHRNESIGSGDGVRKLDSFPHIQTSASEGSKSKLIIHLFWSLKGSLARS